MGLYLVAFLGKESSVEIVGGISGFVDGIECYIRSEGLFFDFVSLKIGNAPSVFRSEFAL